MYFLAVVKPDAEATADLGEDRSEWPEVAIIILNWNNYEDTAECLESLKKVRYPNKEVIVVDNGSADGSGEQLENEFGWCKFLFNNENLGFSAGNNIGIEYALENEYPYVLLLNNDTVVESEFLTPLIMTAEQNERRAIVSGLIYEYGCFDLWYAGGEFSPTLVDGTFRHEPKAQTVYEVGKVTGALALLPQEFVESYNILNEDYFIGLEDTELSWVAKTKNWKLLVNPKSHIHHKVNSSRGMDNPYTHYNSAFNRFTFSSNHHSHIQRMIFLMFFGATRLIRFTQWSISGNFPLIYATLLGVYDYYKDNCPKKRQYLVSK